MEQEYEASEITLIDEGGNEITFIHVLTFMYEDERYMALTPDTTSEDDDEADIVFMHIVKADGEDGLEPVENEVLLDELFEVFCELLDGEDDDEDGGDR
ncbi:MAG: DUF1292 domain-containing protein [Clostridia bacterium]|nr:DUF1292 domain-containing protein [Clostridia bacterium]